MRVLATLDRLALFNEASSEGGRRFIWVNRYRAIVVIMISPTSLLMLSVYRIRVSKHGQDGEVIDI